MRAERKRLGWLLGLLGALTAPAHAGDAPADPGTPRLREIYVPFAEFKARVAGEPKGVVMTLDEYRALVLRGLPRPGAGRPELPPLAATVLSALHEGALSGGTVRMRATLDVRSTREGWVLLDLGHPIRALGSVQVDGQPGWVVVGAHRARPAEGGATKLIEETSRAYLLIEGAGAHRVEIAYSLLAAEADDRWSVEGTLVPASASRVEIEVPGEVEARGDPPFLDVVRTAGSSRLVLAAGGAERFRLEWRRMRSQDRSGALLAAEHHVSFFLRADNPVFSWDAVVSISRGKAAYLDLAEPPSATVVRVDGPLAVSWARVEAGIRVFLAEPAEGQVRLRLSGVLQPGARFELAPPRLAGAFASSGSLALHGDRTARLAIESASEAEEIGAGEARPPPHPDSRPGAAPPVLERVFAFRSESARVTASLVEIPVRFETRAAFLLSAGETAATIEGAFRISVDEGRLHGISLSLPEPWRLASLAEAPRAPAAAHGIRHEEAGIGGSRSASVFFGRAATRGDPVDLRLRLEHATYGDDRAAPAQEIDVSLPAAAGAARSRTDVAVSLALSMDARMPALPGWRSIPQDELQSMGLAPPAGSDRPLAAGLSTEDAAPRLRFTLVERPARGEYRLAVLLLALERQVRVRADMRIAAIDRPVEEIAIALPAGAVEGAVVAGDGIEDSRADLARGARIVRYAKPWLGTRQIRVEYEVPHQAGASAPIPSVELRVPGGGWFGSERFLLVQSRGPVEVETSPGPGLTPAVVEDIPDLAEPWSEGRVLSAFRFRASGDPGSFRTTVHPRAPVLASLAREVRLTTVIGRDGTSRTRAEVLVARSRAQHLVVLLPPGARSIAAAVDGDPLRAVEPGGGRSGGAPAPGGGGGLLSIPLPTRSHTAVTIVYERIAGRAPAAPGSDPAAFQGEGASPDPLGAAGTWEEEGPRFPGMPVGVTAWTVHHPSGYRFVARGGNLVAARGDTDREGYFARTFFARILRGEPPLFTALSGGVSAGASVPLPPLAPEEALGARAQDQRVDRGLVEPAKAAGRQSASDPAPSYRLIPEGVKVEASKLGGDARLVLAYEQVETGRSARLGVFIATLVAGALLWLRRGARAVLAVSLAGLLLGTMLPVALAWSSPLLVVPACEGLLFLAVLAGAAGLIGSILARRRAAYAGAALVVILSSRSAVSEEAPPPPLEGVLIPYDPRKGVADPRGLEGEVYIPEKTFEDLWRRAYPETAPVEPPPHEVIAGTGEYLLRVDEGGSAWRMTGSIPVRVLTDRWVALPLSFEKARIVSLRLDGEPRAVAEGPAAADGRRPALLPLRGRGVHRIDIELAGTVAREHGSHIASVEVVAGAGATLRAELPRGANVVAKAPPGAPLPVTVTSGQSGTSAVVDLGLHRLAEIRWSFPGVEADTGTQLESLSYTEVTLTFEGCAIDRRERLRATGRAADSAAYRALAGWRITEVTGTEVSRWTVAPIEGGERLQVFFARPVAAAEIRIRGRGSLDRSGPLPVLALEGAARSETFVGLKHGGGRRFAAEVLAGMRRTAREDVMRTFGLTAAEAPDRAYHAFGAGEGETLAADADTGEVESDTRAVLVIEEGRLTLAARSRLSVSGLGPLRFEVLLPEGWEPRSVRCAGMRSWDAVAAAGGRRLSIRFEGRARSGTEVLWTAERAWGGPPGPVDVPAIAAAFPGSGAARETREWAVAASEALDVTALESPRLVPAPLDAVERWATLPPGAAIRFALRTARSDSGAEAAPRLETSPRPSALAATAVSIARLADDALHVNARFILRPKRGSIDRFRFRLPPGAELSSIETANQRSRETRAAEGGLEVEIVLHSPSPGEHPVDISYRMPRGAGPPRFLPVAVLDGERSLDEVDQYAAVLQGSTAVVSAASTSGLVSAEARDFPWFPAGVPAESLRPAFRATSLDWAIVLAEEEIEVARGPEAVVRLAELSTAVGGDGVARTQASYGIENRSLQFLIVEMPPGSSLWGVSLNGKAAAVGEDTGPAGERRLRIPLEHVGAASLELEVVLRYEERPLALPSIRGRAALSPPRIIGPQVVETIWNVEFPDDYGVSAAGGNMREVAGSVRNAKRIENLLGQLDKISKAAGEADSSRVRSQAARELRRLEQVLGDNAAELAEKTRGAAEEARRGEIGQEDLERQWSENDALMEKTRKAQVDLREARQGREGQAAAEKAQQQAGAPVSKDEQAFQDAANYQKRSWAQNEAQVQAPRAVEGPVLQPGAPDGAAVDLRAFRDGEPFQGLAGAPPAPRAAEAEEASPKPLEGLRGLKPIDDSLSTGAVPGLEAPEPPEKGTAYTFVRSGGDAVLELAWTRRDLLPRFLSATGLALAAVAVFLAARRGWVRLP